VRNPGIDSSLSSVPDSGSEACKYLRLIYSCITQLKAQGPSRTGNESKKEEDKKPRNRLELVERAWFERGRDTSSRALRGTRPHNVGYIGGCDQEQGGSNLLVVSDSGF